MNNTFYHGTSLKNAKQILKDGLKGRESQSKAWLAPLKDRVYLTKDLGEALIYALGAAMVGMEVDEDMFPGYGVVLVVVTKSGSFVPDEDWVGQQLTNVALEKRNAPGRSTISMSPQIAYKAFRALPSSYQRKLLETFRVEKLWEVATWARVGKTAINYWMKRKSGERLLKELTKNSPNVAHKGERMIKQAWVFNKVRDNPELYVDGGNFFEVAKRLY